MGARPSWHPFPRRRQSVPREGYNRRMPAVRFLVAAILLLPAAARADMPAVQSSGRLRVLASADENPAWFSVAGTGAPGFERELLEGFARLHRLKLEVVPVSQWESAIPDLVAGKGDLI